MKHIWILTLIAIFLSPLVAEAGSGGGRRKGSKVDGQGSVGPIRIRIHPDLIEDEDDTHREKNIQSAWVLQYSGVKIEEDHSYKTVPEDTVELFKTIKCGRDVVRFAVFEKDGCDYSDSDNKCRLITGEFDIEKEKKEFTVIDNTVIRTWNKQYGENGDWEFGVAVITEKQDADGEKRAGIIYPESLSAVYFCDPGRFVLTIQGKAGKELRTLLKNSPNNLGRIERKNKRRNKRKEMEEEEASEKTTETVYWSIGSITFLFTLAATIFIFLKKRKLRITSEMNSAKKYGLGETQTEEDPPTRRGESLERLEALVEARKPKLLKAHSISEEDKVRYRESRKELDIKQGEDLTKSLIKINFEKMSFGLNNADHPFAEWARGKLRDLTEAKEYLEQWLEDERPVNI